MYRYDNRATTGDQQKSMQLKKSAFAKMCGVSRQIIYKLCDDGGLVADINGKIDTDNPQNSSYLLRHTGGQIPLSEPATAKPTKPRAGKKADHIVDDNKMVKGAQANNPDPGSLLRAIAVGQRSIEQNPAPFPGTDLTASEMQTIARRALFEAQKIQRDSELKALSLDKEHGNLIDREIFDTFAMEMMQAIQQGFIDVIPKQALLICSRLGAVGHEAEVEDCINNDHKRRLEEVKRIVETHLRKRYYQKPEPKRVSEGAEE